MATAGVDDAKRASTILQNPDISSAIPIVKRALSEHKTLIVVGECSVEYSGRAVSKLKTGDCIVIIKSDGSVLVHRPSDYAPVNWQPPGCLFETLALRDKILLRAVRQRPREVVRILFSKLQLVGVLDLVDEGEFALYASEEDMRRAILAHPDMVESGFRVIKYEKRVNPGFIDVYGIDATGRLTVIEVKRRAAGKTAVLQLARYVEALKGSEKEVRGIIVAPGLAKGSQTLLATLNLEFIALSPEKCANILVRARNEKGLDSYIHGGAEEDNGST